MHSSIELNFKEYGSGEPLLILHGFLGSLDNWHTLATRFGKANHVFSLDLRNHGKSAHTGEHSINLMIQDLKHFVETKNLNQVSLIGHSMGGKVVMQFALQFPDLVKNLVVVDIAPRQYQRGHDDVFEAIFAVDFAKVASRKDAEKMMEPFIKDIGTIQFILKNLERNENGSYQWKMNLKTLHRDYEQIIIPIESEDTFDGNVLIIKGGKSRYISNQDEADFRKLFPLCQFITIENAGHWVHAESPEEFFEAVSSFLNRDWKITGLED